MSINDRISSLERLVKTLIGSAIDEVNDLISVMDAHQFGEIFIFFILEYIRFLQHETRMKLYSVETLIFLKQFLFCIQL